MDMDSGVRVVCFDWGGVILRICRSWSEACAAAGLPVREASASPEVTGTRKIVAEQYQRGVLTTDEFLVRLQSAVGSVYSTTELLRIHDHYLIEEYPGIDRLIDRLHEVRGVKTAMLSNTNEAHWARQRPAAYPALPSFTSAGRLNFRHASHVLGHAKPSAEIYREFERRTGFRANEILFFDDLNENVVAARQIGWRSELVDHTGDTAAQMTGYLRAHGVFRD